MKLSTILSLTMASSLLLSACTEAQGQNETTAAEPAEKAEVKPPEAHAVWVEIAAIEGSDAALDLSLPGEVRGFREAALASSQGGLIERVGPEVGDTVKKGERVLKVDTALYKARQGQAGAELRAAKRELTRVRKIESVIAGAELDQAQARVDTAKATHRVAEIQAQRAIINAPFDGVVAERNAEKGEVASPGVPLLRIVQLDPVLVAVSVSDRDVVSLSPGTPVHVHVDANAQPMTGKILRINPVADPETRAFEVEIEVPNGEKRLLPGMITRISVHQEVATDSLIIPQSFLVTKRNDNGVFVVEDGVARWRSLTLGAVVHDQVVITDGLKRGDNVVVVGQRALADGDRVIISREGRCCEDGRPVFEGVE